MVEIKLHKPEENLVDGKYRFEDLVDVGRLKELFERFSKTTGFTTGLLTHPGQRLLVATGWRSVCTDFHRKFESSEKHCKQSNLELASKLENLQELNICECANGLVDGATPVIIKGVHVASLFTGQVSFKNPDPRRFEQQARIHGYDLDSYLESVKEVPIVDRAELEETLRFLSDLAIMLGELGLANIKSKTALDVVELSEASRRNQAISSLDIQTQLLHSEERHRGIFNDAPIGIFYYDEQASITDCNRKFVEIIGSTKDVLIGLSIPENISNKQIVHSIQQSLEVGASYYEGWYDSVTAKKRTFVRILFQGIRGLSGEINAGMGMVEDITERRLAEQALRESEERFRNLAELLPEAIFETNANLVVTYANNRALNLFGLTHEDYVAGIQGLNMFAPEDHQRVWSNLEARMTGEHLGSVEYLAIKKDGTRVPVLFHSNVVMKDGKLAGLRGAVVDITERKAVELELERSMEKYQSLVRNIPGITYRCAMDESWTMFYMSDQVEQICGYPGSDFIQNSVRTFASIIHRDDIEHVNDEVKSAILEKTPWEIEYRVRHEDGHYNWVFEKGNAVENEHGAVEFLDGFILDISARKRAEEEQERLQTQLTQAQKMESVGRLAGGVAHDFNNMLNVIIGHSDLLLTELDPAHSMSEDVQQIRHAAKRSADLTRQLLAFARKQTVTPKLLDLNESVESLLKMLRRLIGEHIELIWKPAKDMERVKMDPVQIDQLLANLVINARDAIVDAGTITIETGMKEVDEEYCRGNPGAKPGMYAILSLSDDGQGMSGETMAHIFEPFFTTKKMGEGTGLGLSTVYGIVKQNNGFVKVYSELNQGTTFTIHVPIAVQRETAARAPKSEAPPIIRGNETVMLVEDEAAILSIGEKILRRLGYQVVTAATPAEAIRKAEKHSGELQLLITDVVMPEMNGREMAKRILTLFPNMETLFMSGYTADVIAHQGILDESINFLQKPFTVKEINDKVRAVLDRRAERLTHPPSSLYES